jgi:hypothetical protein
MDSLSRIALERALTRRNFIRSIVAAGAGSQMLSFAPLRAAAMQTRKKTVVVTFGGGARDEETFAPEGQENIPYLLNELIPQATFFTQVVNRGILGHYVATASLATGTYESFDNFAHVSPQRPTIFEYFRKDLGRPSSDAWVIAPSNGFNGIGQSNGSMFASGFGAEVVLPKQLLAAALAGDPLLRGGFEFLLQDNYEDPFYTSPSSGSAIAAARLRDLLRLSVQDLVRNAGTLLSADELSVYVMEHVMKQFAPDLLWITLHDMDIAHSGAYSLYIDAIQRTDRLCSRIWKMVQNDPEYRGCTTMFILPDFGRDSDMDAGGNGFQHHRTGDPLSRTTWLMALGPHVRENVTVDRPVESLDLAPTLGSLLGVKTPHVQGVPIAELL